MSMSDVPGPQPLSAGTSRRVFLQAGASLVAGGAAAEFFPGRAGAQPPAPTAADPDLERLRAQRRILLRGGIVLSLDPQVGDFEQADVLIEDGVIRAVGPNLAVAPGTAAVVDAAHMIVLPGFIDTHHHSYQGILRSILANGLLDPDYRRDIVGVLTPAYQPSDAYAGVLITALGALEQGITTVVDTSQVSHTPEHTDACIQAFRDAGIRTVFAYSRGDGPQAQYPQDLARLRRTYFASDDQLLTLALGASLSDTRIVEYLALAREVGALIVSHGVNDGTEATLLALGAAGLLGPDNEYIHCTHLSAAGWAMIRDTGGHVSLSVPIEMTMGHGLPGIQAALEYGVRPSLSSDVDVTMAQDPFTNMRAAFTLQRLLLLQRARAGETDLPPLLTCREVLEFATVEGARCAHLEHKVGTLTPGKEADIVLLRTDRLNVWPVNDAAGAVVTLMDTSNVDTVFVAGTVKKWRGRLVEVDEARVRRLAAEARDAVVRRAGFPRRLL